MLELYSEQIHLWLVFFDEIRDDYLLEEYRRMLTKDERCKELRFHFAKDQRRYLITRALVRTTLSRYAPIQPYQWFFSNNAYGRPIILNDNNIAKQISFNVSHTEGLIILGVTRNNALGVDAENVSIRQAPIEVAHSYFSEDEVAALNDLPIKVQRERFFDYWTLKESYIKARGMGLSIPLDQFSFHFPQNSHISFSVAPQLDDNPLRWRFWQFKPTDDYLATVCADRSNTINQQLVIKTVIPLRGEETLDYKLMRKSK